MRQRSACLVSVVVPVRNRHASLARALDSVYAQRLEDCEVIVVDDASSPPIAPGARPRLMVLRHPRNRGPAAARNSGVARARGKYVAFLDSDDIWQEGKLAEQVAALEAASPGCIGVLAPFAHAARPDIWFNRGLEPRDWFGHFLMGCRVAPGSTLLARRELLERVGPQDEKLRRYEDWDWLLRAARRFDFAAVTERGEIRGHSGRPTQAQVLPDLRRMAEKWLPQLDRAERQRFRAALSLEEAAVWSWNRHYGRFAAHIARATVASPATVAHNLAWRWRIGAGESPAAGAATPGKYV